MLMTAKSAVSTTTTETRLLLHVQNVKKDSTRQNKVQRRATSVQLAPKLSENLDQDRAPLAPSGKSVQRPEQ